MTDGESRKIKLTWLVIGAIIGSVISLSGNVVYDFVIIPSITVEEPEIKLRYVDQKLFNEGDIVDFTLTIENKGSDTASDLLIYAIETTENEGFQAEWAIGYSKVLQVDDMTDATFTMRAPDDKRPEWNIKLFVTTTDDHIWTFDIVYEFLADSNQYQKIS